ncbi:hypothetical protein ACRALDRAFT_207894 [Sodiomyces alcalophilus JCM 7366]|uniref:uncharacterized protein n=1 Tax=Sodiomyces alcalophilus JCM 7366 TaxID=591952 RepID=UPI0039B5EDBB
MPPPICIHCNSLYVVVDSFVDSLRPSIIHAKQSPIGCRTATFVHADQDVFDRKLLLHLPPPDQRHRHPQRRSLSRSQSVLPPSNTTTPGSPAAPFLSLPDPKQINLSPSSYDPAFGAGPDASIKAKIINLIASVRTLMRSTQFHLLLPDLARKHPSCLRAHVVPPGCVGPYAPPMGEGGKWGIQDSNPTEKEANGKGRKEARGKGAEKGWKTWLEITTDEKQSRTFDGKYLDMNCINMGAVDLGKDDYLETKASRLSQHSTSRNVVQGNGSSKEIENITSKKPSRPVEIKALSSISSLFALLDIEPKLQAATVLGTSPRRSLRKAGIKRSCQCAIIVQCRDHTKMNPNKFDAGRRIHVVALRHVLSSTLPSFDPISPWIPGFRGAGNGELRPDEAGYFATDTMLGPPTTPSHHCTVSRVWKI